MVATVTNLQTNNNIAHIKALFDQQKQAYRQQPMFSSEQRIEHLNRLKSALIKHQDELAGAINEDFSCRSVDETKVAEVMVTVQGINYAIARVKKWMKPSRRHVGVLFMPASNHVLYQPLGVVGIIVPWNYPVQLALSPLCAALAAGNRVMLKMSEFTPATNAVLKRMLATVFPEDHVAVIEGEVDVATAFSEQPWDHLIFTGSTAVGHHVMAAAAKNLTPVTLELGGKSPVIVAPNGDLNEAAERICFGKSLNAGQTCIAPDYVLVPKGEENAFISAYQAAFKRMYPTIKDNSDYSAIVNERQYERLQNWVAKAAEAGADITVVNPANESFEGTRKMPLHIVQNAADDTQVMQDELFGPILPVVTYDTLVDAINYINDRPRPLALYIFSHDKALQKTIVENTHSGGVSINDTLTHIAQDDMPFGGIGPSGMGHYHGKEGFISLSKAKAIHAKGKFNSGKMAYPPYGKLVHKLIYRFFIR